MKVKSLEGSLYLCHSDTSWLYWVDGQMERYFSDPEGWGPTEKLTKGAALVAPHPMLKWSDEDESI